MTSFNIRLLYLYNVNKLLIKQNSIIEMINSKIKIKLIKILKKDF
jgi:hypothetical protein